MHRRGIGPTTPAPLTIHPSNELTLLMLVLLLLLLPLRLMMMLIQPGIVTSPLSQKTNISRKKAKIQKSISLTLNNSKKKKPLPLSIHPLISSGVLINNNWERRIVSALKLRRGTLPGFSTPLRLFIVPAPYLSEVPAHVDTLGGHLRHPGVFQHAPGASTANRFLFEAIDG